MSVMQAVILAGGLGSRLAEETTLRPKPMVEIGGRPILWHILKLYSFHGINDFIICCGYKGYIIKEYFANYFLHQSDVTFDIAENRMTVRQSVVEPWRVTLVDTGEHTGTGGRLRRIAPYLSGDFCMTYGDGLADLDIKASVKFHKMHGKLVTVTAVQPPARFGALSLDGNFVNSFREKPEGDGWVNGGFFVLSLPVLRVIEDDSSMFEAGPMQSLTEQGQVAAFFHSGFWQPMDTIREKEKLNELWSSGNPPWRVW
jgi:glucose-1-phosphate cytidylyltransferase